MTKIYTVTFCALDESFEGNVFWHSCLLLSEAEEGSKMKVVDNWGFYGLPTTTRDTWIGKFKIKLGLDVDFDNHGMLRHEDTRYLETGYGLHGVTFELIKEKFDELRQKCQTMADEQEAAIREIVHPLGIEGKPADNERIYSHEHLSQHIYRLEQERAKLAKRESRLKPFTVNPTLTMWGPALNQSQTCKTQSLKLLTNILSPQQLARLTENGRHPTVPRYSGRMEKMYLHSSGPLRVHRRKSGEVVHYRDAKKDKDVEIYWTLPPQEIDVLSDDTKNIFSVSELYHDRIKEVIEQLQRLEWLFINAIVSDKYLNYRDLLIERIRYHYNQFSRVESAKDCSITNNWYDYTCGLFELPRNDKEKRDYSRLKSAKDFIDTLYIAMADGWEIADEGLCELDHQPTNYDENPYYNPLEAIAAYLSVEDKKKLCKVIKRSFVEPLEKPGHLILSK